MAGLLLACFAGAGGCWQPWLLEQLAGRRGLLEPGGWRGEAAASSVRQCGAVVREVVWPQWCGRGRASVIVAGRRPGGGARGKEDRKAAPPRHPRFQGGPQPPPRPREA